MRAGTTCYLGVNVEGALFSVGDGHYRQGEGESCGTAVEGAMDVTLIVELIKGGSARRGRGSSTTTTTWWSGRRGRWRTRGGPARSAWSPGSASCTASTRSTPTSCSPRSAARRSPTSSTSTTARSRMVEKALLPPAQAYGGMHRHLRARSRKDSCSGSPARRQGRTRHRWHEGHRARVRRGARGRGRHGRVLRPHTRTASTRRPRSSPQAGTPSRARALDVADRDALAGWVAATAEQFGGIDVVVANVSALAIGADRGELGEELPGRPHAHRAAGRGRAAAPR